MNRSTYAERAVKDVIAGDVFVFLEFLVILVILVFSHSLQWCGLSSTSATTERLQARSAVMEKYQKENK